MKDLTPRIALILVFTVSHCLAQNVGNPFLNNRDCEAVDLVFVLDCSWSLRSPANFEKELNFVSDVVSVLDFSRSRVSVVTFSDDAKISIYFDQYNSLPEFQSAIKQLPWVGGNTYTDQALEMLVGEVRTNQRNRAGVTTMGVVITDGGSTDPYKTEDVVRQIHADGIEMFSIGVGTDINQKELEMIATDPDREHMFLLDDLNSLSTIKDMLASRFCRGSTPRPTQPPPENICESTPADVFFIIDKSSSLMNQENFNKELAFVARVIDSIIVGTGPKDSRVGVISFSTDARLEFGLDAFTTNKDVEDALLYVEFSTGNTYTHKAINIMLEQFRLEQFKTDRRNARKIGVIVTDGQSTDPFNLRKSVDEMKREKIDIFAIGAGNFKIDELNLMASDPKSKHVFKVDELDDLSEIQVELNLKTCKGKQP